ncbi:MAG TPA: HD domain-containing phosphohydrolase [Bryobacteraceae bacterium]|jgi:response regulator RpfG family c-di-GMP phosphodiesterase|nr:HD domain-containing phosphohydrolase [Bryobacteraceae bacterium]
MTEATKSPVLLVDDEPDLLAGLSRSLRSERFEISTASSGAQALSMLRANGPFAVIVSDLRMPEMDGITLLQQASENFPDTVRVLFTGQLDMECAIAAVNKGAIFRFILKPCQRIAMALTLNDAVEQHRLITAERVLLEQTLHGSIKALTDILSLVAPAAFGRASRLRHTVRSLVTAFRLPAGWPIEVAVMLSQIGCVTLPPSTLDKMDHGEALSEAEQEMLRRMPGVVQQILGNIPRLEPVRDILRFRDQPFDRGGSSGESAIPWGARALKLATDLDALESEGLPLSLTFDTLRGREGWYDTEILQKLAEIRSSSQQCSRVRELHLAKLRPGMILAQDVRTEKSVLFIARGQEVTAGLLEKFRNFAPGSFRDEAIRVVIPDDPTE